MRRNCTLVFADMALALTLKRTTTRRISSVLSGNARYSTEEDKPNSFLNSEAHKHKVFHEYFVTSTDDKKGKYAFPLGLALFGFVVYIGFIREYGEKDQERVALLTRDISDRVPPATYKKMKREMENEKK